MTFARAVLGLSALAFGGLGAAFLAAPTTMASLVGVALEGPLADGDVRAVYGGLQLGCALFLGLCAADARRLRLGLVAQLCLFGGLVLARTVGLVAAGFPGRLGVALLAAEVTGLACGAIAWRALAGSS